MINVFAEINWLAVLAGTAVFAVLGGLYLSVIIPKAYAVALGYESRDTHTAFAATVPSRKGASRPATWTRTASE